MKIYSDSHDTHGILSKKISHWPISPEEEFSGWGLRKMTEVAKNPSDALIILGQEETLYNYPLKQLDNIRRSTCENTLIIITHGLYGARGSGRRRWITTQHDQSNMSVNFILPNQFRGLLPFELQTRIAVGIARTLERLSIKRDIVSIQYPLHYLLNGKKIAGHLVEIGKESLRIGLGVNTNFAPVLPENDELAQKLYNASTSFNFTEIYWIDIALEFLKNITSQLAIESHDEYLSLVTPKIGSRVQIYKDDGGINLGSPIEEGVIKEISPNGDIVLENGGIYNPNYHMHQK